MSYRLLSDATRDLSSAVEFYEKIHADLALEFLDDFEGTIRNVVFFPEAWTQVTLSLRRCLFQRFPYAILYSLKDNIILVAAIMHLHQDTEEFLKKR